MLKIIKLTERKIFALLIIASFIFFLPIHQLYSEKKRESHTLEHLVERSLSNFELLKASKLRIDELKSAGKKAGRWENPEFGASLGRKTADESNGYSFDVTISQNFYYPGKQSLREKIVQFEENRARLSHEEMKLFIRYEVTRLAYQYAVQLHKTEHTVGRLKRFKLIGYYMKGRRIFSPQRIVERRIIQSKIRNIEKEVLQVKRDALVSFSRLNLYTGLSGKILPEVAVSWYRKAPVINSEGIERKVLRDSFAVRRRMESLKKSESEVKLSRKKGYPDFGISFFYGQEKTVGTEKTFGGGITVPIPVFTRNRNGIDMNKYRSKQQKMILKHERKNAAARLRGLLAEYRFAAELVKRFPVKEIDSLEASMRYADREFRKGRVNLQTYLEMDTMIHELLESIFDAQTRLVSIYSEIRYLAAQ